MTHLDREVDTVLIGETISCRLKTNLETALLRDLLNTARYNVVLANLLERYAENVLYSQGIKNAD